MDQQNSQINSIKLRQRIIYEIEQYSNDPINIRKTKQIAFQRGKEQISTIKKPCKSFIYHDHLWQNQQFFINSTNKSWNNDLRALQLYKNCCVNQSFHHSKAKTPSLSIKIGNAAQQKFSRVQISKMKNLKSLSINLVYNTEEQGVKVQDAGINYLLKQIQRHNQLQKFEFILKNSAQYNANTCIDQFIETISKFRYLLSLKIMIEYPRGKQEDNIAKISNVAKNLPNLVEFQFSLIKSQEYLTYQSMHNISEIFVTCQNLQSIELQLQNFIQQAFCRMIQSVKCCKNLKELKLKLQPIDCFQNGLQVTQCIESLRDLILLERLELNVKLFSELMSQLLVNLPKFEKLSHLSLEFEEGNRYTTANKALIRLLKQLQSLELLGDGKSIVIIYKLIMEVSKGTQKLKCLKVSFSYSLRMGFIIYGILDRITELESLLKLELNFEEQSGGIDLRLMSYIVKTVTKLYQLKDLAIFSYSSISELDSQCFKEIGNALVKMKQLTKFYFTSFNGFYFLDIQDYKELAGALNKCNSLILFQLQINNSKYSYRDIEQYFSSLRIEYYINLE